jgi:hypothetical protein
MEYKNFGCKTASPTQDLLVFFSHSRNIKVGRETREAEDRKKGRIPAPLYFALKCINLTNRSPQVSLSVSQMFRI